VHAVHRATKMYTELQGIEKWLPALLCILMMLKNDRKRVGAFSLNGTDTSEFLAKHSHLRSTDDQ